MIDREIKKMLVNALVEVVDSAPLRKNRRSNRLKKSKSVRDQNRIGMPQKKWTESMIVGMVPKSTLNLTYGNNIIGLRRVNREKEFETWMGYVNKTLNTTSRYVNKSIFDSAEKNIYEIASKPEQDYDAKTNDVCKVVLEYAKNIADL